MNEDIYNNGNEKLNENIDAGNENRSVAENAEKTSETPDFEVNSGARFPENAKKEGDSESVQNPENFENPENPENPQNAQTPDGGLDTAERAENNSETAPEAEYTLGNDNPKGFGGGNNGYIRGYDLPHNAEETDKTSKKGMRIFALILALIIVVTSLLTAGYFLGRSSTQNTSKNFKSAELSSKKDSKQEDISTVFENTLKSVVSIVVYNNTTASRASGVIYSSDGYIVTNDHIYSKITSPKFIVTLSDGTQYDAKYIAGDTRSDLAVLKIDAKGLDAAVFGDSAELGVGEDILTIGYPGTSSDNSASLTSGIVSALDVRATTSSAYSGKYIQINAAINPGNSGGALVNMYSQVVGITSAKQSSSDYEGIGYAIPSATVKQTVDLLIKEGCVKGRAKLGITYKEINKMNSEIGNLPMGIYIASISDDSGMSGIGINVGDVITYVNDKQITYATIMLDVIDDAKAGDTISITVYSAETGDSQNYSVTLTEDAGSSSFSLVDANSNGDESSDSSNSDSSEEQGSGKTFDFPND